MKFRRLSLLLLLASSFSAAQTFKYVAINVPNAKSTVAMGINNAGTIVGWYISSAGHTHGFRLQNAKFTTIDFPTSTSTVVNGINDYGDVVGTYQLSGSQKTHGFIKLHTGTYRKIDFPSATFGTSANGINKYLIAVGGYSDGSNHGFIYRNGTYTKYDAPTNAAPDTILNGISNLGVIVGQVFSGDSWRGFWKSGSDLDFLQAFLAPDNIVYGVNGRTDLVGARQGEGFFVKAAEASEAEGSSEKFPALTHIQFQTFIGTYPMSINYSRAIVGWYYDNNFVQHGFLAVPQ